MKLTLDARVQDALHTVKNVEEATGGSASRLAYSLRQQLDSIADEIDSMTWEYAVEEKWLTPSGTEWRLAADTQWYGSYREADASIDPGTHSRIVRRIVSSPEVINE